MGELALPGKAGVVYLGSSPCPHTLSGLLAASESILIMLFPGKMKWADRAGTGDDSQCWFALGREGGQVWASSARCQQK